MTSFVTGMPKLESNCLDSCSLSADRRSARAFSIIFIDSSILFCDIPVLSLRVFQRFPRENSSLTSCDTTRKQTPAHRPFEPLDESARNQHWGDLVIEPPVT